MGNRKMEKNIKLYLGEKKLISNQKSININRFNDYLWLGNITYQFPNNF